MTQERKFWMVYGLGHGAPTVRHKSEFSAINEAKRLARINPDVEFYVLETKHLAVKRDVDVSHIDGDGYLRPRELDDDIPF